MTKGHHAPDSIVTDTILEELAQEAAEGTGP
jgi:hypothetical protein